MRENRRARKSITAVLLAVTVLLSWSFPAFAEGSAEADPTASTIQEMADTQETGQEESDADAGETREKPDGTSDEDTGKSGQADSIRSKPDQPLALGASGIMAACANVSGTEVEVHLDNPGDLQAELDAVILDAGNSLTNVNQITKLTVTGDMNGSDMDYIWDNGVSVITGLKDLDMSGATYVQMGGVLKADQFRMNNKLETIALPGGILYIGTETFDLSGNINLTTLASEVFSGCRKLRFTTSLDGDIVVSEGALLRR